MIVLLSQTKLPDSSNPLSDILGAVHIEAPELFTTCGSVAAYKYHTLAVSQSIIDVDVRSPSAGKVEVTVLTRTGSPSAILISEINSYLSAEERRPLCDTVLVRAPIKVEYSVDASLILLNGYDSINVKNEAEFSLRQYLSMSQGRLGKDILPLEIMTALKVDGVYDVVLHNPTAKKLDMTQWGFCTDINLSLMEQRENG
ncbi:Baseplate J-like protein [Oligella ureolytica]|uniref:Baseplate J-like protein n=2 Tax=Oligella ureolytica TaxID=90244 RepID=A0A378XFF5_9BURK|nr:baseplate J/gp47 family protein [Oligella ureolytica]SUA52716.1 Baseplate J-like protein [Oligella ureolytica]SUA58099.1 Baseplate J-like protein [Oligella ureolytica]